MRVTLDELWESINRIMFPWEPRQITAQECGYVIPEALKQCAVVMVRDDPFGKHYHENPNQWALDQQNVIDGLRELRDNGYIQCKDQKDNE